MEAKKRRRFSKEFKEDVLNILRSGDKNVQELSQELGIASAIIYRWYRKSKQGKEAGEAKITDKDREIRELRAKLADVTEERDILKKAVHIFSQQGASK